MKNLWKFLAILLILTGAGLTWWKTNPLSAFGVLVLLTILALAWNKVAAWGDAVTGTKTPDPTGVAHREKMIRDAKKRKSVEP